MSIRTQEQFNKAMDNASWLVNFHKKSFWIVPTSTGYEVSSFKVDDDNLPAGCSCLEIEFNESVGDDL